MSSELTYFLILSVLFLIPKTLQRVRIPSAVTSFALGIAAPLFMPMIGADPVVKTLATFGIVSLFVFAGLEIEPASLKREKSALIQNLVLRLAIITGVSWLCAFAFKLDLRAAILFALALVTPSAGFILDSLQVLGATPHERNWIKLKAIVAELLALALLFGTVQSLDPLRLVLSALALVALAVAVPMLFRFYARFIAPTAPNSEFGLIMVLGSLAALATRYLGVYYLLGAFVVGVAGRRYSASLGPSHFKRLLRSIESFAAFFIPFYFLYAGTRVTNAGLSWEAVPIAVGLFLAMLPVRLGSNILHRKLVFRDEPVQTSARIALAIIPTLVFTLVIAEILRTQFNLDPDLYVALSLYAVMTAMVPSLFFRSSFLSRLESPTVAAADGEGEPLKETDPPTASSSV